MVEVDNVEEEEEGGVEEPPEGLAASNFRVRTKTCPESVQRMMVPSRPTPKSVTAVKLRRRDHTRCGFGTALESGSDVEGSAVQVKTSPRDDSAANVWPHDAILSMLGLDET